MIRTSIKSGTTGHIAEVEGLEPRAAERRPSEPPSTPAIFREYGPFVWRLVRRLGIPERETPDVCQEIFLVVHRRLGDFEGRSSVRTWLYGIAVRVVSDHRRKVRRRPEVLTDALPDVTSDDSPDRDVAIREARALLDRIVGELDDDKRAVFVLYEIEELAMADVAEAVGCPLQTAYSRLHAAREHVWRSISRSATSQERE